jgi:uncharacterized protein GlcG (DUF336 family)
VAQAAKAAGASRLVHISALGASPGSRAAYARTKAAGERAVLKAFPEAVILQPSVVFGPEDDLFNRFAQMAAMAPMLPLIGGGRTRFQPVYVGDVAAAVALACAGKAKAGATYELGGPETVTFRQLLDHVQAWSGRKRRYIKLPFWAAKIGAALTAPLPNELRKAARSRASASRNRTPWGRSCRATWSASIRTANTRTIGGETMKLEIAQKIVAGTFAAARAAAMKPLSVAVLDDRGALKLVASEDGTSLKRAEIAIGKAHGSLAMGLGSRTLFTRAQQQPYFIAAATHAVGNLIPVPGGVLILDAAKSVIGAIGVSGDTSDNDEAAALAGIGAAGLTGDPGA